MAEYCLVVWCGLDAGYQQNTFSKAGVIFSNALILCGLLAGYQWYTKLTVSIRLHWMDLLNRAKQVAVLSG